MVYGSMDLASGLQPSKLHVRASVRVGGIDKDTI